MNFDWHQIILKVKGFCNLKMMIICKNQSLILLWNFADFWILWDLHTCEVLEPFEKYFLIANLAPGHYSEPSTILQLSHVSYTSKTFRSQKVQLRHSRNVPKATAGEYTMAAKRCMQLFRMCLAEAMRRAMPIVYLFKIESHIDENVMYVSNHDIFAYAPGLLTSLKAGPQFSCRWFVSKREKDR